MPSADPPSGDIEPPGFLEERPGFLNLVHRIFGRIRWFRRPNVWLHAVGMALALSIVYLLGLGIAYAQGSLPAFIGFYTLPLILAEIGWGVFSIDWLRDRYRKVLWEWRNNFGQNYQGLLKVHWLRITKEHSSRRFTYPCSAVLAGTVVATRVFNGAAVAVRSVSGPIVAASPALLVYYVMISASLGYVLGWALHIIVEHIGFLRQLSNERMNPYRVVTGESDIVKLANLSFLSSLSWFGAVALATAVLYRHVDVAAAGLYVFAVAVGFAFFLVPQIYLHRIVVEAKSALEAEFRSILPRDWQRADSVAVSLRTMTVLNLIRAVDSIPEWPIDVRVVTSELIAALLPIAAAAAGPGVFGH